jgi:hypothetical protein
MKNSGKAFHLAFANLNADLFDILVVLIFNKNAAKLCMIFFQKRYSYGLFESGTAKKPFLLHGARARRWKAGQKSRP